MNNIRLKVNPGEYLSPEAVGWLLDIEDRLNYMWDHSLLVDVDMDNLRFGFASDVVYEYNHYTHDIEIRLQDMKI